MNTGLQGKNGFLKKPMKEVETQVSVKINNSGPNTLVDSDVLNKKDIR